jgi:hypothetical protein
MALAQRTRDAASAESSSGGGAGRAAATVEGELYLIAKGLGLPGSEEALTAQPERTLAQIKAKVMPF